MKGSFALIAAAVLGAAVFFTPSASAADFGLSVNVGNSGYYENVWVPPVYRTEYYYGQPRLVIVVPGYYRRVYRPHYHHYHHYSTPRYYYGQNHNHHNHYNHRDRDRDRRGHDHRGHDHRRR